MSAIRDIWFEAVAAARQVLAAPETAARWEGPSALREFSVRGLAGHLARAAFVVEEYLDGPPPAGRPMPAAAYFPTIVTTRNLADPLHARIRERGEAHGAAGPAALLAAFDAAVTRLRGRLAAEPADRVIGVVGGHAIGLDDYLVTRMVELTVHMDDLAVSVDIPTPTWPRAVSDAVIAHLVDAARFTHGDLAVVRALTRRERDPNEILRVF